MKTKKNKSLAEQDLLEMSEYTFEELLFMYRTAIAKRLAKGEITKQQAEIELACVVMWVAETYGN